MKRRDLLVASSIGFLLGSGGCLNNSDENTQSPEENNDEDGPWEERKTETHSELTVKQFAVSSTADWWTDGTDKTGYIESFTSKESALDVLDFERVDEERREVVKSLVQDTDYEGAAESRGAGILYVESVGPHTGYDEIEIPELTHGNTVTRITGTAKAKRTSEEGAEELTFPSAIVKVDGNPRSYDVTVIDGWENEAEIEGTAHGEHHAPLELDSISWLNETDPGYEYGEPIRSSGTGSTVTDSVELRDAFHALYFETVGGSPSGFTVDLVRADTGETETRLVDIETIPDGETGSTFGGEYEFVPSPGTYQLDVQSEASWDLTLIDLAAFRSDTPFEAVSVGEEDEIHASGVSDESYVTHGGGNHVFGAVRLSPGVRIKLAANESDLPPAVAAYTEFGQKESLFEETGAEGETVETTLDGVAWFDSRRAEGHSDDWELHILPQS